MVLPCIDTNGLCDHWPKAIASNSSASSPADKDLFLLRRVTVPDVALGRRYPRCCACSFFAPITAAGKRAAPPITKRGLPLASTILMRSAAPLQSSGPHKHSVRPDYE